ncbi:sulfatase family protein [Calycomorphotria hydatis]|uniref:Arylsulfatase n=1 Tax=Calycomorphotria hydatis TaxID=2528027 RepID=A0A517TBF9_9PLAN|nr:sulfatase [Calycomorphotria hydatis]QDT65712.1 Arylsulfatase [Calycomorphotria hydatis]
MPRYALLLLFLLLGSDVLAAERPNIIFFLSDDQRNDFLGCAGHPYLQTPTIDRLASEGVRFENMFVTTSICAASRATILTGLVERTHGYTFGKGLQIPEQFCETSYPAELKKSGYRTGFYGKFGVTVPKGAKELMFDEYEDVFRNPYWKKQADGSRRHVTDIIADRAIEFVGSQPTDQPFCLSISFNAAHAEDRDKDDHYPWPPTADDLYTDIEFPPPALSDPEIYDAHPQFLKDSLNRERFFWRWDTPEKWQKNVRAYYRLLSGMDAAIGRVLNSLDEQGFAENTIVIFTGDNGYYQGSRGFAGKWSHYEESLRVPLVIYDPRLPKEKRGRVIAEQALNLDLAPTILDYVGVEVPKHYQGHSLKALVNQEETSEWPSDFFCEHLMVHEKLPKWEGVHGQRYKYARYFDQSPPFEYLHDLEEDPQELRNLVSDPTYSSVLTELRARTDEMKHRYEAARVE